MSRPCGVTRCPDGLWGVYGYRGVWIERTGRAREWRADVGGKRLFAPTLKKLVWMIDWHLDAKAADAP